MSICKPLGNLGDVQCAFDPASLKRVIFAPLIGSDGSQNVFASESAVTKSALQALFDESNEEDRLYPLPVKGKNIGIEVADALIQEYDDGSKNFRKPGRKTITSWLVGSHPLLIRQLEAFRGQAVGFYGGDVNGNFWYQSDVAQTGEVQPIPIDSGSIQTEYIYPKIGEAGYLLVSFEMDDSAISSLFRYIPFANLDFNINSPVDVYALRDTKSVYSNESTTEFTADIQTIYNEPVTGLIITDFTLYNNTTSAAIVITSVTESADGIYDFVIPAQTSLDNLTLTPVKSKFDFSAVVANTIDIP